MNINNLNYRPPTSYSELNTEQESRTMTRQEALEILDTIPTIGEQVEALEMAIEALEQEPIIHCKNCKHWHEWENGTGACRRSSMIWEGTDYDDYCSFAERKEQ